MPGEEFRVALQEAQACGARVCFGDRPVQVLQSVESCQHSCCCPCGLLLLSMQLHHVRAQPSNWRPCSFTMIGPSPDTASFVYISV